MADIPRPEELHPAYWSYLLRLWRLGGTEAVLRASLTNTLCGDEKVFPNLEALLDHLRRETEERRANERPVVVDDPRVPNSG